MPLTPNQLLAMRALRKQRLLAADHPEWDGWGLVTTGRRVPRVEDGQARMYYGTALGLERRGLVEVDYKTGRVRLR